MDRCSRSLLLASPHTERPDPAPPHHAPHCTETHLSAFGYSSQSVVDGHTGPAGPAPREKRPL